jgi:hypothetical protein
LVSEIYYSFIIDEIEHDDSKRPRDYIKNSYFVSGFRLSEELSVPYKRLTSLEFLGWHSETEFLLKANESIYIQLNITKDKQDNLVLIAKKIQNKNLKPVLIP